MGLHTCCNRQIVKRGLWSPEEDEKLIKYMNTYEHTSWSVVPGIAGLQRCGKSCRLRWINYLRPDLKRGAFTQEEAQKVFELHSILGNKWSRIAKFLDGRTDNEVKNFWNSSIKKKLLGHHQTYRKCKSKVSVPQRVSSAHRHHQNIMYSMTQNPQMTNQTINPVLNNNKNISNAPMNNTMLFMPNSHINMSPPFFPYYTTACPMTVPFEANQVPTPPTSFDKIPQSSTFFYDQHITDYVELSESSNTAHNEIIVDQEQVLDQISFTSGLENRNNPVMTEFDDHLAFTSETTMIEYSDDTLFFDNLEQEIQQKVMEFDIQLNPAQEQVFPADPNGELISQYINHEAHLHPNHINNIESLMVSFASSVNSATIDRVNPTPSDDLMFNDEDYIENSFIGNDYYGSIWGPQP